MHVEPVAHDSEHDPVHSTVQVEPAPHVTLLLAPTVTSQLDDPLQSILHDVPHVPVHVLPMVQASVQLLPLQPESPISHDVFAGQAHEDPVHVGGGGGESLHAAVANNKAKTTNLIVIHAIANDDEVSPHVLCAALLRKTCTTAGRTRPSGPRCARVRTYLSATWCGTDRTCLR